MAFLSQPPTLTGFSFKTIGKGPSLLGRMSSAPVDKPSEPVTSSSSPDLGTQLLPSEDDNESGNTIESQSNQSLTPQPDIDIHDDSVPANNPSILYASNPGLAVKPTLADRLTDLAGNFTVEELTLRYPSEVAPSAEQVATLNPPGGLSRAVSAASHDPLQHRPPEASNPTHTPSRTSLPPEKYNAAASSGTDSQDADSFAALRSVFSSLPPVQFPNIGDVDPFIQALRDGTTSTSTSAKKAAELAQRALECAQSSVQAAQACVASADTLQTSFHAVVTALGKLAKGAESKKQSWDEAVQTAITQGHDWISKREKEEAALRREQVRLKQENAKLEEAARLTQTMAGPAPKATRSGIQYPLNMPDTIQAEIEEFARQKIEQEEDRVMEIENLERARLEEELLDAEIRKKQQEMDRSKAHLERMRSEREERERKLKQKDADPKMLDEHQGEGKRFQAQQAALEIIHTLTVEDAERQIQEKEERHLQEEAKNRDEAMEVDINHGGGIPSAAPSAPLSTSSVVAHSSSAPTLQLQEANLRELLKVRTKGVDQHDNKSITSSPISPTVSQPLSSRPGSTRVSRDGSAESYMSGNVQSASGQVPPSNNLSSTPALRPAHSSLPPKPVGSTLPPLHANDPQSQIQPSQQYVQKSLGMPPTPVPSPIPSVNDSHVAPQDPALLSTASQQAPDVAPSFNPPSNRAVKKNMSQEWESDSSQWAINRHGSEPGVLPIIPPTAPAHEGSSLRYARTLANPNSSKEPTKSVEMKPVVKEEPVEATLPPVPPTQRNARPEPSRINASANISAAGQSDGVFYGSQPPAQTQTAADPLPVRRKPSIQPQSQGKPAFNPRSKGASPLGPSPSQISHPLPPAPSSLYGTRGRDPYPPSLHRSHSRSASPPRSDMYRRHGHYSPPHWPDYSSRRSRSPPPPESQVIGRKRPLDSGAPPLPPSRRYRHAPGVVASNSDASVSSVMVGGHEYDVSDLPPRPPTRVASGSQLQKQENAEPHGPKKTGDRVPSGGSAGSSKGTLFTRIEQSSEEPRGPKPFLDRLQDPQDMASNQPVDYGPYASIGNDSVPDGKISLSARLSNPSSRGRGRGRGRGGKSSLKKRIASPAHCKAYQGRYHEED